jgi:hypothetical protein
MMEHSGYNTPRERARLQLTTTRALVHSRSHSNLVLRQVLTRLPERAQFSELVEDELDGCLNLFVRIQHDFTSGKLDVPAELRR